MSAKRRGSRTSQIEQRGRGRAVAACNYYSIYTTSFNWLLSWMCPVSLFVLTPLQATRASFCLLRSLLLHLCPSAPRRRINSCPRADADPPGDSNYIIHLECFVQMRYTILSNFETWDSDFNGKDSFLSVLGEERAAGRKHTPLGVKTGTAHRLVIWNCFWYNKSGYKAVSKVKINSSPFNLYTNRLN